LEFPAFSVQRSLLILTIRWRVCRGIERNKKGTWELSVYSILIVITIINNGVFSSDLVMGKRELVFKTEELCQAELPSLQKYLDNPNWNASIESMLHQLHIEHTSFDATEVCSDKTPTEYASWLRGGFARATNWSPRRRQ
jgi:hypothetical protein